MSLHKRTVSGNIADTLTYTVSTGDAYGAQVTDVLFFDGSGNQVIPTGGNYTVQWSVNGRDWVSIATTSAGGPIKNWQTGGYVAAIRVMPDSIIGADSWSVDYRFHGIGDPSASILTTGGEDLAFENGDSYRIDYPFIILKDGDPIVLKYIVNEPAILTVSGVDLGQGGIEYKVFTEAQTTETSPFTSPISVYPKNLSVPFNPSPIEVFNSGTATFTGQQNTTIILRTATAGGNRNSAIIDDKSKRGFGPSIVYVEISAISDITVDTIGVLKQEFYRK